MNKSSYLSSDTIVAHCSGHGAGAIALIRLSGPHALQIANSIAQLPRGQQLIDAATHTITYGSVKNTNSSTKIDNVLFLVMHAPATFTGENTVEITCHNNQFIIDAIINAAIVSGARLAQPGEFSKRAVLNGKIDLLQAEAIDELIHAQTEIALKQSLSQLDGSLSEWVHTIEHKLIHCLALSEASFEFIEEEQLTFGDSMLQIITQIIHLLNSMEKSFNQQQQIRQGIRIALIGAVNAGKSSLFNALLSQNRSIVTDIAGTTRDVVEAGLYKNGNYWTLIDTAGLRLTNDIIEQEGIRRSHEQAQLADIILLIYDSSRSMSAHEQEIYLQLLEQYANKIIIIRNKDDLMPIATFPATIDTISFNAINMNNLPLIESSIQHKITALFKQLDSPFLLNQRQLTLLLSLKQQLEGISLLLRESSISYEIVSLHIKDALEYFAQLSGKSITHAGMDAVFRTFCVGK